MNTNSETSRPHSIGVRTEKHLSRKEKRQKSFSQGQLMFGKGIKTVLSTNSEEKIGPLYAKLWTSSNSHTMYRNEPNLNP